MGEVSRVSLLSVYREFDEFLRRRYSKNESTRRSIISAVHIMLKTGKGPDELPLETRSRTQYRRAWRLWMEFCDSKDA